MYHLALERENSLGVALPFGFTFLQRISFKVPTVLDILGFLYKKSISKLTTSLKEDIADLEQRIEHAKTDRSYTLTGTDLGRMDSVKRLRDLLKPEVLEVLTSASVPLYVSDFTTISIFL